MAVISKDDYLKIAGDYGNARDRILSSVQYLFDAVYEVVMLQAIIPEVDLLAEFYNSYQVNTNILKSPVTLLNAVRTLNNHVLNRSGYTDIDSFLEATPAATVSPGWADLCAAAGFPIDPNNVA